MGIERAARLQPGWAGACAVRGDPRHASIWAKASSAPLFSAFGPELVKQRGATGSGVAMVTSAVSDKVAH